MSKTLSSCRCLVTGAAALFLSLMWALPVEGQAPATTGPTALSMPRDTTHQGLKVLTIDDYALWRSVGATSLSPDGRWVSYSYSRREVDDSLFIKPLAGPGGRPTEGTEPHVVVRGSNPTFFGDSRWVAYYVNPREESGGRAAAAPTGGAPAAGAARGAGAGQARALVLLNLQTRDSVRWESVQSFSFADGGGALILKKRAAENQAKHKGTDLIVRYLVSGEEELLAYVDEFALDKVGSRLAYTLDTPEGESNGVHLLDLTTRARRVLDAERKVTYARLTWGDERRKPSSDALAVMKGRDDEDLVERVNALLLWPALSRSAQPVVLDPRPVKEDGAGVAGGVGGTDAETGRPVGGGEAGATGAGAGVSEPTQSARVPDPFPEGWVLSEGGAMRWAPDASRVFVATKPQLPAPKTLCKPETPPDTAAAGSPKTVNLATRAGPDGRPLGPEEVRDEVCPEFVADVDIWHVGDRRLQSVQMVRANRDRGQTYQGVVHLEGGNARFVQLADTTMESIQISTDGRVAVGRDGRPYESDWLPSFADHYLVDVSTGERTLILEKHLRALGFSPRGDHYLYWKDGQVWSYRVRRGDHVNLTAHAPVSFVNEEFDRLGEKPPHGIAGWTMDSTAVILQDRYDLWLQPLDGSRPSNLTQGQGAEEDIRFRIVNLDPEEALIDLRRPVLLTAFGQWTKKDGFYRLHRGQLQELLTADARFNRPVKADSADVLLYTVQDFETFPDYHVSGLDFRNPVQVTDANPQQEEYNWGRRILFEYETSDGVRLQGTLAIPYDYVEGEKRPMLINFYEKVSQSLHAYPMPAYRSSPNFAGYVSSGYLVMQPDIHFRLGPSHAQMLECIELAIDKVIELGYVDPSRIGLHGHSYSGQGAAYIATRSDRFAAITAGAAATNLVSDFNQLWKSSGTSQHGYDTYGQGRFATNPYDDFDLFVDQSAAQNAHLVNTPLLLLHGTDDGSVEWLQSVEFYNGLRWNGKEVILLSYPGEGHGLRQYGNQKDFQIRMRQFFDHHLWGQPAPRWIEDGRSFLQKQRELEMMRANQRSGSGGGGSGAAGGGAGGGRPG
jgi:dipeptidyl aminopeptidase/acylaminoacyl peptidase